MFTRTAKPTDVPERERIEGEQICPPHDFDAAWAAPNRADMNGESVPALYCHACALVLPFCLDAE